MTPRNDRTAKDYERKDVDGNVNQQLSMDIMVSELQQLEAEEQGGTKGASGARVDGLGVSEANLVPNNQAIMVERCDMDWVH
ncbi:hypothetical protein V6N11_010637 [Hibiscus sabdariffa]|uniref:Uncharacterized protein n=1 Tax=Hibiscus sabdariffa TaxID=183260 RepID=A0ABR2S6Q4_9ROSI